MEGDPEPIHEPIFRGGHQCLKATLEEKIHQRPRPALIQIRIEIVHEKEGRLASIVSQKPQLSGAQGYHRRAQLTSRSELAKVGSA
jgi:hypothetical protein